MVEYRMVKYCGLCRTRFLVNKGESRRIYCDDCQKKVDKSNKERAKKEDL